MSNFAIIGAAGYVAPRHMKAIKDTGHRLVAATDPHDAVGVLDRYFPDVKYFQEIERFDRHIEKLRMGPSENQVNYVSICSPNYLHDAHARLALRSGADAICEKPLVINPWNLDQLAQVERETGGRIYTILQLRLHPVIRALKAALAFEPAVHRHTVQLTYVTARGPWYHASWKGREERSGGLASNIGIHFFDMLIWLFGAVQSVSVTRSDPSTMAGALSLDRADVSWVLSVDAAELPEAVREGSRTTFRAILVDGRELDFTSGFADLHTLSYEEIMNGRGFGIDDARPSIELVRRIRDTAPRNLPLK